MMVIRVNQAKLMRVKKAVTKANMRTVREALQFFLSLRPPHAPRFTRRLARGLRPLELAATQLQLPAEETTVAQTTLVVRAMAITLLSAH